MASSAGSIGILGGSGMLGSAISKAVLNSQSLKHLDLWISNRTGKSPEFAKTPRVHVTQDNRELAQVCDVLILSVPPALFPDVDIDASDRLVISVMAGITAEELCTNTKANRVVRAMSSPAASLALAYSPWVASPELTTSDRDITRLIFEACGKTDELFDEKQIDHFTAMTGPVPGFVAYFAQCMADHATRQGIAPDIADRAIRQLFLASGTMLADGNKTPAEHVHEMVDYAGTTAAGLTAMMTSDMLQAISDGLLAAAEKARSM